MNLKGKVHRYGNHVDTDVIIPARYLNTSSPAELAAHCMEDIDGDFIKKVQKGDMIVAGKNFGCGSCREHAPIAIKECGISCIIAESFARIFFRNSINIGLPVLECPEAASDAEEGHELEVDPGEGIIRNLNLKKEYRIRPLPDFIQKLVDAGGLVNYVKSQRV